MSMRGWAWGVPAALLGLVALAAVYATTTPRYALYRLGAAVQRHDVDDALRYFDVERIADRATDVLVADYLARQPAPATRERGRSAFAWPDSQVSRGKSASSIPIGCAVARGRRPSACAEDANALTLRASL